MTTGDETRDGDADPKVPQWLYEPDEDPKRKHHWTNVHAGFVELPDGTIVGKCPAGMTTAVAESLLNQGLPYPIARWATAWPSRIYVVHEGVVYRATPTRPGASYHAFPELPERLAKLPRDFRAQLVQRARDLGCEREVRRWMQG